MGLFDGNGGDGDGTIIGIAVFCTVMSLMVTFGVTLMLPSSADYEWDEVTQARMEVSEFTGNTMLSTTPWKLTGVYTPWVIGSGSYRVTTEGFLYGESIDYEDIGKTTGIHLSTNGISSIPLSSGESQTVTSKTYDWAWYSIFEGVANIVLPGVFDDNFWIEEREVTNTYAVWNYTGYRYEFDPMLPFRYTDESQQTAAADGSLSIVWYSNRDISGISGGLVIYGNDQVYLSQIAAADIIGSYNTMSGYSSQYPFDFLGTDVYLNIRFDPEVINSSMPLEEAWDAGLWSIAITSPSAGTFLDARNSTSFSGTIGNLVSTFKEIFTFSLPNLEGYWNIILWLLVSFPAELAFLLFCTRLGVAGIPAAILGNGLLLI